MSVIFVGCTYLNFICLDEKKCIRQIFRLSYFVTSMIVSTIVALLVLIAVWKIFTKAGEKGWKSIIPIYNVYIFYKISWKVGMFAVMLILSVIAGIGAGIFSFMLPQIMNNVVLFWVLAAALTIVGVIAGVLRIISLYKLSKAFGHGGGYTVGLIFLTPIFLLILALGSSQYVGADR